jgi:hypothetical protein
MLSVSLNLRTMAVSQYVNYDFNSFCEMNGKVYGAGSSGIFELEVGEYDEVSNISTSPIAAEMQLGPTDLGIFTEKRLRKCIVALEADGPVKMTVSVDEESGSAIEVSQIPGNKESKEHAIQIYFVRELRGRYFTFNFQNINGSHFGINNIEVFVEILLRKPK